MSERSADTGLVTAIAKHYRTDPDRSPWGLTPRMALRLVAQCHMEFDTARLSPESMTDGTWILPSVALARATPEFLDRFTRCFADIADRLLDPTSAGSLLHCTGEEIAMSHVIDQAKAFYADGGEPEVIGFELDALADGGDLDVDFDWYSEILFDDKDYELLWMPQMDGIADDDDAARQLALANLRPDRWFLPFRSEES